MLWAVEVVKSMIPCCSRSLSFIEQAANMCLPSESSLTLVQVPLVKRGKGLTLSTVGDEERKLKSRDAARATNSTSDDTMFSSSFLQE